MVAILAVSGLGIAFPALVPSVPAPRTLPAILLLIAGAVLLGLVALRAARTYALSRRGADLAVIVGVWWLGLALVPALLMGWSYLDWWLGHGLEVAGITLVGLPVALDLRRAAPSRTLTGDLRAVDLVSRSEAFMGSHLRGLLARLGEKDTSTDEHTRRVALRAVEVGEELGLPPARLRSLAVGGLLHDVGKLSVPDAILKKPGPLEDDEFAVIRRHPDWGHELVGRVAAYPEAVRRLVRGDAAHELVPPVRMAADDRELVVLQRAGLFEDGIGNGQLADAVPEAATAGLAGGRAADRLLAYLDGAEGRPAGVLVGRGVLLAEPGERSAEVRIHERLGPRDEIDGTQVAVSVRDGAARRRSSATGSPTSVMPATSRPCPSHQSRYE